jgi:hypothetical protein
MMYDALFAPSDPVTSSYSGGLAPSEARFLRGIAFAPWRTHSVPSVDSDWQSP